MDERILATVLDWVRSRHFGKYRGRVVDNQDPTKRGRLKVTVPAVLGALELWAMPCVPYAGDGVGFWSLPNNDTGVWIEFEAGDPSFPIWVGCFWADGEAPEEGVPTVRTWKTDTQTVRLDDDNDAMLLETSSDARVELTGEVVAEGSDAKLTVGAGGVVSEQGAGKVAVTTGSVSVNDGAWEVV